MESTRRVGYEGEEGEETKEIPGERERGGEKSRRREKGGGR